MEDNAVIMAMEHTTVHATVRTREKTAKKVRITFRTLNLLFSVKIFGLLCTAWVWAWWHDIPHATRPGATMARDQIIILKLQQKISCCPQTDRIIYLGGNNHFVIVSDVFFFRWKCWVDKQPCETIWSSMHLYLGAENIFFFQNKLSNKNVKKENKTVSISVWSQSVSKKDELLTICKNFMSNSNWSKMKAKN